MLGPTGRNVAAGMSGGIGYVLDLARHRVNAEMVDVEPLDADGVAWLRDVIERYRKATGSPVRQPAGRLGPLVGAVQRGHAARLPAGAGGQAGGRGRPALRVDVDECMEASTWLTRTGF